MKKLPLKNSTMKEILSVRVRSFSSTRSFSLLSNSPEAIFSFLFFRLNLSFIFFGLDWLRSGLFVWVWSRRFVRARTGCLGLFGFGLVAIWFVRVGGVHTGCLALFGFRLGTFWFVCVGGVRTGCLGLFGFGLVAFWFVRVGGVRTCYFTDLVLSSFPSLSNSL